MVNSTFIPVYQYIKPTSNTEKYFNESNTMQKCSLMSQLRLNKFSIKLGHNYIPLGTRCPLCCSNSSVEHLLFECRALNNERSLLILPLLPIQLPAPRHELTSQDLFILLFSETCTKLFINNLFLFWLNVAKYFDLCSE